MTEIRAFVGHSFEDGESPVVEAFLQYLTSLQKSISSFEWTSARDAEPKELAQKVLEIFSDCNAFIGICTCKERAISHSKLSKSFLLPNQLWGRTEEFEWKASDWVIQEIGMAIGRGIPLILLLENGCRKPGGMQGNVEFIPFDRSSPSDAFIPLMDMIRSLSPPPQALERAKAEAPPETSDEVPQSTQADDDTPDITWKRDRYVNSATSNNALFPGRSKSDSRVLN